MYSNYTNYLKTIPLQDLQNFPFKSNRNYSQILEHVSYDFGLKYLNLIETEFTNITYENIIGFTFLNDKYGKPIKQDFLFKQNKITCSPTSLRYIYHSLVILDHYKTTDCENIVEVGCGYGGLCLAIHYFSKLMNVHINTYNIVDLEEVCKLIELYLDINRESIKTNVKIHYADT